MPRRRKQIIFLAAIALLLAWTVLLYFYSPVEIVSGLGVRNGYAFVFLAALFNGLTTIIATSFYPVLVTFNLGGLNLYLLSLVAGVSAALGNMIYFYIGYRGREALPVRYEKHVEGLSKWVARQHPFLIPFVAFIYFGFTPLPNELMIITTSFAGYSYKHMILPLVLGNIALMYMVQYVAIEGISLFEWSF